MNVDHATALPASTYSSNYPLFSGWPFLSWLTDAVDEINEGDHDARFLGAADVHRSYDYGGIATAVERCNIAIEICTRFVAECEAERPIAFVRASVHRQLLAGWLLMKSALEHLRDTNTQLDGTPIERAGV